MYKLIYVIHVCIDRDLGMVFVYFVSVDVNVLGATISLTVSVIVPCFAVGLDWCACYGLSISMDSQINCFKL